MATTTVWSDLYCSKKTMNLLKIFSWYTLHCHFMSICVYFRSYRPVCWIFWKETKDTISSFKTGLKLIISGVVFLELTQFPRTAKSHGQYHELCSSETEPRSGGSSQGFSKIGWWWWLCQSYGFLCWKTSKTLEKSGKCVEMFVAHLSEKYPSVYISL